MNKLNARKVVIDGKTFDSQAEAFRYQELLLLQRAKQISDLKTQVEYVLIPVQKENGKVIERKCSYIADFVYNENGKTVVEDVKGYRGGATYEIFKIKRKLMLQVYGIKIKEIC